MLIHIFKLRQQILKVSLFLIGSLSILLLLSPIATALSSATASYEISPTTGSYSSGDTLTVSIIENSPSSAKVNGVQANLSYPDSLLDYTSTVLAGPFTICAQNTGGNGKVSMACASPSALAGKQTIAYVEFKVIGIGRATISMTSGTDIDNTSGQSVWNKELPQANFNLTANSSQSSSSTPVVIKSDGSLSIAVTNTSSQKITNASVSLNSTTTRHTDANGTINFAGVTSGLYHLTIKAHGYKPLTATGILGAGQNKLLEFKLESTKDYVWPVVIALIIAVVIVLILIYRYSLFRTRRINKKHH